MMEAQRFEPTSSLGPGTKFLLGTLVLLVAGPLYFWWREADYSLAAQATGIAAAVLVWAIRVGYDGRHRGALVVGPAGLRLEVRSGPHDVPWNEIHRVHRFSESLVVETTPPHRRFTLSLDGHDVDAIMGALRHRASLLDLTWMEKLDDALR